MVNDLNNVDGEGTGVKMFPIWCHPGFSFNRLPWKNPAQWRALHLRYRSAVSFAAMTRDRDSSGVVAPDPQTGKPRVISYDLAPFDRKTLIDGVVANCEILVAAGVDEIYPITSQNQAYYIVDKKNPINGGGITDPRFKEFIAKLKKNGYGPHWYGLHQMGTCRMGTSEKNSVVDSAGRVWGVPGLYVADASIFPSPPGSNPMIPTMALAVWISNQIIAEGR
jgi:choline dehydrogenase-like flavoprotein